MKTINLRECYPAIYTQNTFCEVPDEVAEDLLAFRRKENALQRQIYRYKAYYSLDREDGIENDVLAFPPPPEELYVRKENLTELYAAIQMLTEKQRRRLYARSFLERSYADIARREDVSESSIRSSVCAARARLKRF